MKTKEIFLCAICNISSGNCAQDCKYCAQSARYNAKIEKYKFLDDELVLNSAKIAHKNGAIGFCLVSSGGRMNDKTLHYVARNAHVLREEFGEDFNIIACNGMASKEQLKELKKAGVSTYNHNLETSQGFYPTICKSHDWSERVDTCIAANEAGLNLMSGGIFGLGESVEDRISLFDSLIEVGAKTSPINFFHPNIALPMHQNIMSKKEAISIIRLARMQMPNVRLMVAGGRQLVFGDDQRDMYAAGVDAIVAGNYLTTKGSNPAKDKDYLLSIGLGVKTSWTKPQGE